MAIEKSASHPRALVDSMLENCQQPQHSDPGLTELQTTLPTINSGPLLSSRSDTSSNQQAPCDHDLEAILGLGRRCSLCSSVMDETPTTLEMPTPTPPCMELKEEPEVKASPMDQNSSKQGLQTGPILEEMRDSEQQSCNSWCNTELLKLCLSSGQHESLLVLDDESRVASQQSLDEDLEWDTSENNLVGSVTEDASIPHLEFESRFESGNLRKAIQVSLLLIKTLRTVVCIAPTVGSAVRIRSPAECRHQHLPSPPVVLFQGLQQQGRGHLSLQHCQLREGQQPVQLWDAAPDVLLHRASAEPARLGPGGHQDLLLQQQLHYWTGQGPQRESVAFQEEKGLLHHDILHCLSARAGYLLFRLSLPVHLLHAVGESGVGIIIVTFYKLHHSEIWVL